MISANKKQRNCGVDCLRSVAMFAIVLQHCILHSDIVSYNDALSVKYGLVDFVTFFLLRRGEYISSDIRLCKYRCQV